MLHYNFCNIWFYYVIINDVEQRGYLKIILIMGLPGSGKTTLANHIVPLLKAKWLNADKVRKEANDWDFSNEGREKQSKRMWSMAKNYKNQGFNVVADFVCPTPKTRSLFPADYIIWMDTIKQSKFDDTNEMFVKPKKYDLHVVEWRHPSYYKELRKLREEAEEEIKKQEEEEKEEQSEE